MLAQNLFAATGVCSALACTQALAQDFPNRPLRIVASEAGGGGDFSARLIAQHMVPLLGQPVVVENRGGGVIAGGMVAYEPADGQTLLLICKTFWLLPLLCKTFPYNLSLEFVP